MRGGVARRQAGVAALGLNHRVTLSYDGSEFAGFQAQDSARFRTVQVEVEKALAALHGGRPIRVAASGRTDQGVHAYGQVISFDAPRDWPEGVLARALNAELPRDVRALDSRAVPESFHARRSATSKLYRYVLDTGPWQHPTRRKYAGHVPFPLDEGRVARAAALFLGRRDFRSLQTSGSDVKTTVRRVTRSSVAWVDLPGTNDGGSLRSMVYDVEADGFLRRMVRSIVGGLVAAGRGTATAEELALALDSRDRRAWPAAPADPSGLYLVSVAYDAAEPAGVGLLESDDVD